MFELINKKIKILIWSVHQIWGNETVSRTYFFYHVNFLTSWINWWEVEKENLIWRKDDFQAIYSFISSMVKSKSFALIQVWTQMSESIVIWEYNLCSYRSKNELAISNYKNIFKTNFLSFISSVGSQLNFGIVRSEITLPLEHRRMKTGWNT